MALYQLGILGAPSDGLRDEILARITEIGNSFGLAAEISITVAPTAFRPDRRYAAAALYFGHPSPSSSGLERLLDQAVPIIPIVSHKDAFSTEVPEILRGLNGFAGANRQPERLVAALLECVGLLRRQRRVFISYRRDSSRIEALQLYDALSASKFDVFLDTHRIGLGDIFQQQLWHRLSDSDAVIMLDTGDYFDSIWTEREFGAACALNIGILRVGWPGVPVRREHELIRSLGFATEDFNPSGGLTDEAIERILDVVEIVRSKSISIRQLSLTSKVREAVSSIGGKFNGVGLHNGIRVELANGRTIMAYPAVGVPTAQTLHEVARHPREDDSDRAIVFNASGLANDWLEHLDWLGHHIKSIRWIQADKAAFQLGAW